MWARIRFAADAKETNVHRKGGNVIVLPEWHVRLRNNILPNVRLSPASRGHSASFHDLDLLCKFVPGLPGEIRG